ncbi:hypothetical protein BD560DRAFT_395045 [Blakeslea trispora]|nr:hypothetical protein BD560DRAFT_395045 [Blakeslea trispora]
MLQLTQGFLVSLLNIIPAKRSPALFQSSSWTIHWPTICYILHDMNHLTHSTILPHSTGPNSLLLDCLLSPYDTAKTCCSFPLTLLFLPFNV